MSKKLIGLFLLIALSGIGVFILLNQQTQQPTTSVIASLPFQSNDAFIKAMPGLVLEFPKDHASHDEYQTEWWYLTGNLKATDGQEFGYQLTFFRRGIQPMEVQYERTSDWATEHIYLAHFTITNVEQNEFAFSERYSRGAAGLAGTKSTPFVEIWLEDWQLTQLDENTFQLNAREGDRGLNLILDDVKNPVLQGENGYSQKGEGLGNASIYYSLPRLLTQGQLTWQGQLFEVEGMSWMDHEFSTSALGQQQIGWDWFAIHLSNGIDLMVYHIRNLDGSIDQFSKGLLVFPDGSTQLLRKEDFSILSIDTWKSPHSGAEYPSEWKISIPDFDLNLTIKPLINDQELNVSFVYWEGAVKAEGVVAGEAVEGQGYVELTGYTQSMQGRF